MSLDPSHDKYVCHIQFREQLRQAYETGIISDELGLNILKIVNGVLWSHKFVGYSSTWKDVCYTRALIKCLEAVEKKSFNIDADYSPFSYYYRICTNSFCGEILKLKRLADAEDEYRDKEYDTVMREHPVYVGFVKDEDDFFEENT